MAKYLIPNNYLSVENPRQIFEKRRRSNPLPSNRGVIEHCNTGKIIDNAHIFECVGRNEDQENIYNIEKLTNGTLEEMKMALSTWNENLRKINIIDLMDSVTYC